ncbi:peptidyl-tRNA hydrolase 2 [Carex littledalei]|uniref:peptidyl-tRNA hydrolase n=1 Tax=Carex littledalei TaxID=544730 RepID=A0A833VVQ0_9POAL|nr:peptidyl-tRNA hydrolase 2 [Carex littledalei]
MHNPKRNLSRSSGKLRKSDEPWLAMSLRPENFLPGVVIGFLFGLFVDFSFFSRGGGASKDNSSMPPALSRKQSESLSSGATGEELKVVLVVRQDLKMGAGKIASQCAHAATGLYAELSQRNRSLLRQWEQFGQAKIVVSCKNQQEMNKLKEMADRCGLPTFVVSDAGRTQVQSGSRTVLAIGPGKKADVDSVTGKLRLL